MVLKEDQENAINGKPKDSVREEILEVSYTTRTSVQNRHQNPLLPLNHRKKRMVEAYREETSLRGRSPSGSLLDNRAKITSKVSAREHLVIIGILSSINFIKIESGFGDKCSFVHRHVEDQPSKKKRRRMVIKMQWLFLKDSRQLGCVFQDTEPPESSSILRKNTEVLERIGRVQFSKATLGRKHPKKAEVHRSE